MPDAYFAGSSLFCEELVEVAPKRVYSLPSDFDKKASLFSSIQNCKQAYGGLFNALMQLHGDSDEAKARIFDKLVSENVSKRLKEDNVLMLDV